MVADLRFASCAKNRVVEMRSPFGDRLRSAKTKIKNMFHVLRNVPHCCADDTFVALITQTVLLDRVTTSVALKHTLQPACEGVQRAMELERYDLWSATHSAKILGDTVSRQELRITSVETEDQLAECRTNSASTGWTDARGILGTKICKTEGNVDVIPSAAQRMTEPFKNPRDRTLYEESH